MTQKILIAFQVLMAVAVVYLLVEHWNAPEPEAGTSSQASPEGGEQACPPARLAYIQSDSLVDRYALHRD